MRGMIVIVLVAIAMYTGLMLQRSLGNRTEITDYERIEALHYGRAVQSHERDYAEHKRLTPKLEVSISGQTVTVKNPTGNKLYQISVIAHRTGHANSFYTLDIHDIAAGDTRTETLPSPGDWELSGIFPQWF